MREVPTTEAKSHFAELLRIVEYGESIVDCDHPPRKGGRASDSGGRPRPSSQKDAVERFRAWRRQRPRTGMTREEILAARHEGHRR
jgi:hypothetical protein